MSALKRSPEKISARRASVSEVGWVVERRSIFGGSSPTTIANGFRNSDSFRGLAAARSVFRTAVGGRRSGCDSFLSAGVPRWAADDFGLRISYSIRRRDLDIDH